MSSNAKIHYTSVELYMDNIKIDKLIRSKRRSIGLEINDKAELIIRAPRAVSLRYIHKAIEPRREWIKQKQDQVRKKIESYRAKSFSDGEEFLFLGKSYKLSISKDAGDIFKFENGLFILSERWQVKAQALFIYWYKQEAKKIIYERVHYFAEVYGFSFNQIKITSAQKRWGSCTRKNNLNFTWRLMMAPLEIVDSVVVHELVHTKIKNHSKKFWAEVYRIMPDYEKCNRWLKENGYLLNLD